MLLVRRLGGATGALVYVDSGAGYLLKQTIALTLAAVSRAILRGDLLKVGQVQFQRTGGSTGNFSPIDPIVIFPEFFSHVLLWTSAGDSSKLARRRSANCTDLLDRVGGLDLRWGHHPRCVPQRNVLPSCRSNTSDWRCEHDCMRHWYDSQHHHTEPGWQRLDHHAIRCRSGVINGPFNINGASMEGNHVAIGEPGHSRVTVVDITESIFSGGFDQ